MMIFHLLTTLTTIYDLTAYVYYYVSGHLDAEIRSLIINIAIDHMFACQLMRKLLL